MAAKTPDSVLLVGQITGARLLKAVFSDIDDGDTWDSGMTGVIGQFAHDGDNPTTQTSVGCAVVYIGGTLGTFRFYPAEDNKVVDLYILARS